MDMQHAKMLKNDLEKNMTTMVRDFESQTGLQVTNINHSINRQLNGSSRTATVTVDAELT